MRKILKEPLAGKIPARSSISPAGYNIPGLLPLLGHNVAFLSLNRKEIAAIQHDRIAAYEINRAFP